jgi:hypothetical protein
MDPNTKACAIRFLMQAAFLKSIPTNQKGDDDENTITLTVKSSAVQIDAQRLRAY